MREAVAAIRTAAGNRLTAPIYGEIGTGKGSAAEAIHRLGERTGPFERYNCSGANYRGRGDGAFRRLRHGKRACSNRRMEEPCSSNKSKNCRRVCRKGS